VVRTGIFFHYQTGNRLRDFPEALNGILEKENLFFYDALYPCKPLSSFELEPIPLEMLYRTHSPEMVQQVKESGNFDGALLSAAGTVRAAEKIFAGEIDNAFVFTGYGDHHAGTTFFGNGCYFNGAAIAIDNLRNKFRARRFAIIDTDAHHGDGTWEIFEDDPDVLYVCFCGNPSSETKNNVNVQVGLKTTADAYMQLVRETFFRRAAAFQPEILFWNWGYDGTRGEYGDIGLTPDFHVLLAQGLKALADQICRGRFITVMCGGSRRDLASYLCPRVIRVLMGHIE
jgi:acetoin utilization deacetylase AcuC-like enzyme